MYVCMVRKQSRGQINLCACLYEGENQKPAYAYFHISAFYTSDTQHFKAR